MKSQMITAVSVLVAAAVGTTALAQTGTLDQESPNANASFNLDASFLIWQAQARAGMDGQLEGIAMPFTGVDGVAQAEISIGLGDAWTTNIVFTELITLQTSGSWQFVDTTSANIQLTAGDTFVIQAVGNDTGTWCGGSYVAPPDPPLYDEPLWLMEQIHSNGGWRLGFRTYMLEGSQDCLNMDVSKLIAGQDATWDVCGAKIDAEVAVVYGFKPGSTVLNGYAGYCADFGIDAVSKKRVVCRKKADGNGCISCARTLPGNIGGLRILSQAAPRDTCPDPCMSNLDDQVVG